MGPGPQRILEGCKGSGGGDGVPGMEVRDEDLIGNCADSDGGGVGNIVYWWKRDPDPGVSARGCPRSGGPGWAEGIRDPGSENGALGCDLYPERTLPTLTAIPHQSAGLRAGMAPLRPVTGSSAARARAIPGPKSATPGPTRVQPTSGFLFACLRLLRLPAQSPRASQPGAPPAPCAGPHGTGSSREYREAFRWSRRGADYNSQRAARPRQWALRFPERSGPPRGSGWRGGCGSPGGASGTPARWDPLSERCPPPCPAPGRHEGLAGAAESCLGSPGLAVLVPGLEPRGNPAGLMRGRPYSPHLGQGG